jgi:AcrR family transcriptional regulator
MKDTKDLILETAYEMFLCNNYEAVTMSCICRETKLTKGAVYHYFPSKEALFKSVVKKYMIECISETSFESKTLLELIEYKIENIKKRTDKFNTVKSIDSLKMSSQYMSLLIAAYRYYPGFSEMGNNFVKSEICGWKNAFEKAILTGEIHSSINTDTMAMNFVSIITNLVLSIIQNGSECIHEMIEKQLMEMYRLLKK